MALTTHDPNTALIIVDLQKGIVGYPFSLEVNQVVITGVATGTGVEATARQAYEHGFNVTLALDAMTDARPDAHDYSIKNVFPRLGVTGTAQGIIELLETESI